MLPLLRNRAALVATLLGVALLAMWLSGAHGHRPVGNHGHAHAQGVHGHHHHPHDESPNQGAEPALAPVMLEGDHADIKLTAVQPPAGKSMGDLPVFALLLCVVLLLRVPRGLAVALLPEPPLLRRLACLLRPPLRGPPLIAS